ncbi:hypothetical protein [Priestia koreensis]|uniref:hypothetical protein n=1 Tax=Priestia koreensis TaxID=284581 RepID=UPI003457DB53
MKKVTYLITILLGVLLLSACSEELKSLVDEEDAAAIEVATSQNTGKGSLKLLTPTITTDENQLKFETDGIDEDKITYIYVANQKVWAQKIKNKQSYKISIKDINNAHRTDYKPKVQLFQYKDDNEENDMTTFKQARYEVKESK